MEDLLSMMFGGGRAARPTGPRKADDTVHPLKVSLEDVYTGKTAKISINRAIYDKDPEGPIMDRAGNRYNKRMEKVVLDVLIEKGMKNGQRIKFPGQGSVLPGMLPGDVVLVVDQADHGVFQRRGADLIMKREITLLEALAGTRFVVDHLDGHKVLVTTPPGFVIAPDTVKQVPDEGMPVYGHTHVKGVLFVQFEVKFPESLALTDAMTKVLAGILPPGAPLPKGAEAGAVPRALEDADMEQRKARERLAKDAYDSDEEGGGGGGGFGGGQRVQCAQQ